MNENILKSLKMKLVKKTIVRQGKKITIEFYEHYDETDEYPETDTKKL